MKGYNRLLYRKTEENLKIKITNITLDSNIFSVDVSGEA